MTEHLILDERDSGNSEETSLDSYELTLRHNRELIMGVKAVTLLEPLDISEPAEDLSSINSHEMEGTENMVNNNEGLENAKRFKRAYDAVIESIDHSLGSKGNELNDNIPDILNSIDTLLNTPYVSSVPEFVEMVEAARQSVEAAGSFGQIDDEDAKSYVATTLSQAKQLVSGTLVAYRP